MVSPSARRDRRDDHLYGHAAFARLFEADAVERLVIHETFPANAPIWPPTIGEQPEAASSEVVPHPDGVAPLDGAGRAYDALVIGVEESGIPVDADAEGTPVAAPDPVVGVGERTAPADLFPPAQVDAGHQG